MLLRHTVALIISVLLLSVTVSCATGTSAGPADDTGADSEDYLGRPSLEDPVRRPLGRVLVQWNRIDDADGYTLQLSLSRDFAVIENSWTVSGNSVELPLEPDQVVWLRVRSYNSSTSSRWSRSLELRENRL